MCIVVNTQKTNLGKINNMNDVTTLDGVIKKSFMDLNSGSLTIADIGITLGITFLTACFIFYIY